MSVIVIARFPVSDVARAQAALDTKKLGAIHHTFAAGENELIVVDEWDTAESFQAFFNGNPKVEKVTADIGVQGPPTVEVFEKGEAAGTF
jgi:heme-degrading monooxygenase HmoA